MAGYKPLRIAGNSTGLVQEREEFLLPDDAYPSLENAYVWRERILRKKGYELLGRLQRNIGTTDGAGNATITIAPTPITRGISSFIVGTDIFVDSGSSAGVQTLSTNSLGTGILDRSTGVLTITGSQATTAIQYFPSLPVMGIRQRELANSANDETLFFDQVYCYRYNATTMQFEEFLPLTQTYWNAAGEDVSGTSFFWSTNYWLSDGTVFASSGAKLFWETNNTGKFGINGDPPRITDGQAWLSWWTLPLSVFTPGAWTQIDSAPTYLINWLSMLPFRGRMVTFNTWEGSNPSTAINFSNRIRWSTIGNPFISYSAGPPAKGSWRDDIRGQGGFLDIPTSEDIIAIGFVRDNLVIYCERSTWQLRYTGRSISPFQIERVNSEIGAQGPFSSVQFDTSLLAIGDKGIIECDSYKAERIDVKIPDFVYKLVTENGGSTDGNFRIHGVRDFPNRLVYWTIPYESQYTSSNKNQWYPNIRLVYNYENDSWSLFTDSLTTLGTFQQKSSRTWVTTKLSWINCQFAWIEQTAESPRIVGGNQQGFIEFLDETTTNDVSLYIQRITTPGGNATPVLITVPNHNLTTGFIIGISGIQGNAQYTAINGGVYSVDVVNANTFNLQTYNADTQQFSDWYETNPSSYFGGGYINIKDNFSVVSKKFNFLDEGQNIQLGYIDILMDASDAPNPGAIALNVYVDYDDVNTSNTTPDNAQNNGQFPTIPDTFFNAIIPTTPAAGNNIKASKFWQRVFCATRASFLTLEYTFNNAQMAGIEQQLPVQIDAQILWIRKGGRMSQPF